MKYQCTITSGGGKEYDGGIWEKKETAKTISFTCIKVPFFEPNCRKFKINKFYNDGKPAWKEINEILPYRAFMNNHHVLRDWEDGTYTAYPYQSGIPYLFEPINN